MDQDKALETVRAMDEGEIIEVHGAGTLTRVGPYQWRRADAEGATELMEGGAAAFLVDHVGETGEEKDGTDKTAG